MDTLTNQRKIQHLIWRAGFGESISGINKILNKPISKVVQDLFDNSAKYTNLSLDSDLNFYRKQNGSENLKDLSKEDKKDLMKQSREDIKDLNIKWIDKMSGDVSQLREKMTLFWHGHFACRTPVALFCQNQNNTLRKHALGNFGDMLMDISEDPAMLQFLNNQQNKKSSPNENFAREVMELFTMGRGNYTENDIKEAARSFTGWGFNKDGEFTFRRGVHDVEDKTFFGKTGNYTGEDIINMILGKKRTAEYITEKVYKYFVNENINKELVSELSDKFFKSDYDIGQLMKNIFNSDWFYNKENIGARIKSPIELIVGLIRSFNIDFMNPKPLLTLQKALGQMLFNPPNVAGWAGGRSWIDTSSLIYRLKLPEIIFRSSNLEINYKEDPQEMGETYRELTKKELAQYKLMKTKTNLSSYLKEFSNYEENGLMEKLSEYLLQVDLGKETKSIVNNYSDNTNKETVIESLTLKIISSPEYQLC